MKFYTYLYRDIDGNPIYVGKGYARRAWHHFQPNRKTHLSYLLRKRLKDGFKIDPEFLCKNVDEEFAFFVEEEMIRHYGRADLKLGTLLNRTDGGDGLSNPSQETRDKISKSSSGRIVSDETRLKLSLFNIGKTSPNKGKKLPHSEETKIKIGNSNRGTVRRKYITKGIPRISQKFNCKYCNKSIGGKGNLSQHETKCKIKE